MYLNYVMYWARQRCRRAHLAFLPRSWHQGLWGEQGGKVCLAVVVGEAPPKGLILGTGPGVVYVEPPAAVPLNNELGIARAEAASAEEAVLWRLTGQVADVVDSLQQALHAVCLPFLFSPPRPSPDLAPPLLSFDCIGKDTEKLKSRPSVFCPFVLFSFPLTFRLSFWCLSLPCVMCLLQSKQLFLFFTASLLFRVLCLFSFSPPSMIRSSLSSPFQSLSAVSHAFIQRITCRPTQHLRCTFPPLHLFSAFPLSVPSVRIYT